jgi:ferric-dicitrate binding protein FerR (iron transport regulator)
MNDEKDIAALLHAAGPRPVPGAETDAVTRAAREVWRARYVHRTRRPSWAMLVAAAVFVAAIGVIWWTASRPAKPLVPPVASAPVARVEHVSGNFAVTTIDAGATVATDASTRVALRMDGGQSIRIDGSTELRFPSATLVELHRGAVYLDTEQRGPVVIRTPVASVHPAGTRFEVRVDGRRLRVRVREGRVVMNGIAASAGEEVLLDGPSVVRGRIRADDAAWDWVTDAIAMPDIEGRTLHELLVWLAREKGWPLRFASAELESRSRTTILHGSVRDLTAEEALQTILLSAGLRYRTQEGVLWVSE